MAPLAVGALDYVPNAVREVWDAGVRCAEVARGVGRRVARDCVRRWRRRRRNARRSRWLERMGDVRKDTCLGAEVTWRRAPEESDRRPARVDEVVDSPGARVVTVDSVAV